LPVHRHVHGKQATLYAFAHEIDSWLKGRSAEKVADQFPAHEASQLAAGRGPDTLQNGLRNRPAIIAVLPLRNLSGDPEEERFADGLTEELISEIGQRSPDGLRVIALTSVMQYKQSSKSIAQIGQELGADHILEGGIRRYGRRVRLTARLVAARDQAHVWAHSYEILLPPIFSMQQALARRVADALSAKLHVTSEKRRHRTTVLDFAAHSTYVEGRSHFLLTPGEITKSIEHLNLAIERDPKFASSYAELAVAYFRRLFWDYPPVVTFRRIQENASKALKLDPKLARAKCMLGAFHLFSEWAWSKADKESREALKLNPSDVWVHIVRAAHLLVIGELQEAMEELGSVRRLDPQSQETGLWFAIFAYIARCYDLAIADCQRILQIDTSYAFTHMGLGLALAQKGEFALALSHCERARELDDSSSLQTSMACTIYALAGERDSAERLYQEFVAAENTEYTRYIFLAHAAIALTKEEAALKWLNKAYEQREPILVFLRIDPRFDSISADPRFRDLIRRIGLPGEATRLAWAQPA
jgi:TolB-like protein/Flp pilus assembly protein TadD